MRRPSGFCHIAGAVKICEVSRVTLSGLDNNVRSVDADPRSLERLTKEQMSQGDDSYLDMSCSPVGICNARSKVAKDLSVAMIYFESTHEYFPGAKDTTSTVAP